MTAVGLIAKLFASGIAERWTDEIKFTNRFFVHVALHAEYIRRKGASIQSWREMFRRFDPTLGSLNDIEVRDTIALLDYSLQRVEEHHNNGRNT